MSKLKTAAHFDLNKAFEEAYASQNASHTPTSQKRGPRLRGDVGSQSQAQKPKVKNGVHKKSSQPSTLLSASALNDLFAQSAEQVQTQKLFPHCEYDRETPVYRNGPTIYFPGHSFSEALAIDLMVFCEHCRNPLSDIYIYARFAFSDVFALSHKNSLIRKNSLICPHCNHSAGFNSARLALSPDEDLNEDQLTLEALLLEGYDPDELCYLATDDLSFPSGHKLPLEAQLVDSELFAHGLDNLPVSELLFLYEIGLITEETIRRFITNDDPFLDASEIIDSITAIH